MNRMRAAVIGGLVLAATACSNNRDGSTASPSTTTAAAESPPTTEPLRDEPPIMGMCPDKPRGVVTPTAAKLPEARMGGTVSDGRYVYILGGSVAGRGLETRNTVLRYDPRSGEVRTMAARIPSGASAAVWADGAAFVATDEGIVRYDPATDRAEVVNREAQLGATRAGWDGKHVYLFGDGNQMAGIVRFDPASRTVTAMKAPFPEIQPGPVVWDGTRFLVIGGRKWTRLRETVDQVLAFDPSADTVAALPYRLPQGFSAVAGFWACNGVITFGGTGSPNQVVRFEPSTGATIPVGALPTAAVPLHVTMAWDGSAAHLFAIYDVLLPSAAMDHQAHDQRSVILRLAPATN